MPSFVICVIIPRSFINLTPLYGPVFRQGHRNFDTRALFNEKEADFVLTVIRHLPITREATFASFRVYP